MNKLTMVRNFIYVSSVEKLLVVPVTSKYMKEFTLEGRPLHVSTVEKPLVHPGTSKHMKKFTLERNLCM
jgi:hypothetical protein